MSERERDTDGNWIDPDDAPEWPDEVWDRAQISIGGSVIRPASGTLTKPGRPPLGDAPKQQVTLRLPRHVLDHFKAGGAGWQTRIGEVLERHVGGTSQERDRWSAVSEIRSPYMAGKREHIEPKGDDRYVRRGEKGQFTESDNVARSLRRDVQQPAKTEVKPGQGDKGDQKRKK